MTLLERLKVNKGTVSSQLGKELAMEVLQGKKEILKEAIEYSTYMLANKKEKNVRVGAAKIVECVAFERPDMVAPYLPDLLPGLDADEPQTRWMIIRIFGLCARENIETARDALPYAKKYIREKTDGQLCLVSSADRYLGDYGSASKENAKEVFPILMESCDNAILNEHDWIMESLIKIAPYMTRKQKEEAVLFAMEYQNHYRKKTKDRVDELKKACGSI